VIGFVWNAERRNEQPMELTINNDQLRIADGG